MGFELRIKQLRRSKKMTQQELADKLEVSRSTITNWEVGRRVPDMDMTIILAKFFNVTIDYLLDTAPEKNMFELLSRATDFFNSQSISEIDKDKIYQDLMRMYLKSKEHDYGEISAVSNKGDTSQ